MPDIYSEWPKTLHEWWMIPLTVIFVGSLVDIAQFIWLTRRAWHKVKRRMYNKIKKRILEDMKHGNNRND